MAGRTVSRFINFVVSDPTTLRDVPINSLSVCGVVYEEQDMTAFQDAVKGALPGMPDAPIEISGPWDTTAATIASGSGSVPALSGSHTVLSAIAVGYTPLTLDVQFGDRATYTNGAVQFGISGTTTSGYICSAYNVNLSDMTYSAKFVLFPGSSLPAWGVAVET
jgi:hypothetical protein